MQCLTRAFVWVRQSQDETSGLFANILSTQDVPQIEIEEQVVEVPVAKHVQVPMIQKVQKMVEVPQVEYDDQVVDVPVQKQVHIPFQQATATCAKAPKVYKHQP